MKIITVIIIASLTLLTFCGLEMVRTGEPLGAFFATAGIAGLFVAAGAMLGNKTTKE